MAQNGFKVLDSDKILPIPRPENPTLAKYRQENRIYVEEILSLYDFSGY